MAEEPEDEDGLLDFSVDDYFALEGLDSGNYPVTIEVRNQLANLLLESAGTPQHASYEALCRAVMTAVSNLEITSVERRIKENCLDADLMHLRTCTIDVYTNLLNLRTELLERRVISPTPLPKINWLDDHEDYDDD